MFSLRKNAFIAPSLLKTYISSAIYSVKSVCSITSSSTTVLPSFIVGPTNHLRETVSQFNNDFSFPYYFTIPNSEFLIPNSELLSSEFLIQNCEVYVMWGQVITAKDILNSQRQKAARIKLIDL